MYTRALALICIFPRRYDDREVTCDLCVGVLIIIIIFKCYRRRRRFVSTLFDSGRPSVATRHVPQRVCEISDHPPPFNRLSWRPPRISYAPRGRLDLVFGKAPLAGGTSRPVTRTPATSLYNGPRSICV